jgi:hypothetical protein
MSLGEVVDEFPIKIAPFLKCVFAPAVLEAVPVHAGEDDSVGVKLFPQSLLDSFPPFALVGPIPFAVIIFAVALRFVPEPLAYVVFSLVVDHDSQSVSLV